MDASVSIVSQVIIDWTRIGFAPPASLFVEGLVASVPITTLLATWAIAVPVYALFPVAPPRLMDGYGFVDTVLLRSRAYRVLQPAALTDLYASVPSVVSQVASWARCMAAWRRASARR